MSDSTAGTLIVDDHPDLVTDVESHKPLTVQGKRLAAFLAEHYFDLVVFEFPIKTQGGSWLRKEGEPLVWAAALVTDFGATMELYGGAPVLSVPDLEDSVRLSMLSRINDLNRQTNYLKWWVADERNYIEATYTYPLSCIKEFDLSNDLDPTGRYRGIRDAYVFDEATLARVAYLVDCAYRQALWGRQQLQNEFPILTIYPSWDLDRMVEKIKAWQRTSPPDGSLRV